MSPFFPTVEICLRFQWDDPYLAAHEFYRGNAEWISCVKTVIDKSIDLNDLSIAEINI